MTYWSDTIDDVLLNRLAREARPGDSAAMAPTLTPDQGKLTTGFNRTLARREIILQDDVEATRAEWLVLSRRTAYWRPELLDRLLSGGGRRVASRSRQGVILSELWHFPAAPGRSRDADRPDSRTHHVPH